MNEKKYNSKEKSLALLRNIKLNKKAVKSECLTEFYEITDEILKNVSILYENMLCKVGCSTCCKHYGSPKVYEIEWKVIKKYLDNLNQEELNKVHNSFLETQKKLRQNLKELNVLISEKDVVNNIKCPLLQNDMCSIYSIRPMTCRMFGSFISRKEIGVSSNAIYTCLMEKERWDKEIEEKKYNNLLLPVKDVFNAKMIQLNQGSESKILIYYLAQYFKHEKD